MGLAEKDRGGSGEAPVVGGCGSGICLSNLHLKKEMTQIRKAARMLRDPGTSSSWKQSPNSARTLIKQRYRTGNADSGSRVSVSGLSLQVESNGDDARNGKGNMAVGEKDKKVSLCNWERQKSGRDSSKPSGKAYDGEIRKLPQAGFTPSVQRTIKKKSRRSCSGSRSKQIYEKSEKRKLCSKNTVDSFPGISLAKDDFASLICQSGDSEDCDNYEGLRRRASATSPFLAGFKSNGWKHSPVKLLKGGRKDDDSVSLTTPALTTSSYNKNAAVNPSLDSWDSDDDVDYPLDLPGRQGCGISCYWSRRSTPKSRTGYSSCCSPALSDALKRTGSRIICGSTFISTKRRHNSGALAQSLLPLLSNGNNQQGEPSSDSQSSIDDFSTKLEELHLEAMSQLSGSILPSSCRNQKGLEPLAFCNQAYDESHENSGSLSHKYRPMFFDELVGQNVVVQSLTTAVTKGRIAPFYLFQGPRGTGRSSTARVFAAALNCLANGETKPCGVCRECGRFRSDNRNYLVEVDGCSSKGISKLKNHMKNLLAAPQSTFQQFKVFVIEECHSLPPKTWLLFLRILENPLPHAVFVFITTDAEYMPHTILSRCQRHLFSKIGASEMIARLSKISAVENLDIDPDALEQIASNADGSLRDAETMLDQLSLLGKRITISLVNDLVGGAVSDGKLLELLELAMLSNTTETVLRARELLDSGIDPIVLTSQMAKLIVDMIAEGKSGSFFNGRKLTEGELTRLKHALVLLSDAEEHLRVSGERSTWFTATLLQLGSLPASDPSFPSRSQRPSLEGRSCVLTQTASPWNQRTDTHLVTGRSNSPMPKSAPRISASNTSHIECVESTVIPLDGKSVFRCMDSKTLSNIWRQCIEKCHSRTLGQLLHANGRLVSISELKEGGLLAHVAFGDRNIKARAEAFLSNITNSLKVVLQKNVEVKIILLPGSLLPESSRTSTGRRSFYPLPGYQVEPAMVGTPQESKPNVPVKRIESIIREHKLETAWLQAMEKGTSGSMAHARPERNQVLPQDNEYPSPTDGLELVSLDDPVHPYEINAMRDGMVNPKQRTPKRVDCCPISPSLLQNTSSASNFTLDNIGYEPGTGRAGCGGIFCWNNRRLHGCVKRAGKNKSGGVSCFRRDGQKHPDKETF